jgi:mRNA-degrading endonuclease RelE of RelBE toxin-antitoxin system
VTFTLQYSPSATAELSRLAVNHVQDGRQAAVLKALGNLQVNPKYPSLQTHIFQGSLCPHKRELYEAYAENHRPGAYRIFFCYQPNRTIYVVDIMQHP